tara:strand:- start:260 stop:529 length:270 start_codon:yes stop_codon:yes gene_type:complete
MFATPAERLALRASNSSFDPCPFVVRFEKGRRQSELAADDADHAMAISAQWISAGANYVEIFRVLHDGTLNPTIGAHGTLQLEASSTRK